MVGGVSLLSSGFLLLFSFVTCNLTTKQIYFKQGDGRGKHDDVEDRNSQPNVGAAVSASSSSQNPPEGSSSQEAAEVKVQEVKVEAPHPMPPPPPPAPPEPKYDVVDLLVKGGTLSKVQARSAFAMYLVRVQQRLISESGPLMQDDVDALNEQMVSRVWVC